MSSSKIIAKESLSAYERWELPNVEEPEAPQERPVSEDVAADEVQPLTAEQLEAIQREAYQEGFESGRREGHEAGQAEVRAEAQRLSQVIDALAEPLADVDGRVEQELAELALAVARQLVRREIKSEPGQIVAVVREALEALPAASLKVQVHLHPEDAALVRQAMTAPEQGEEGHWRIVEDPALTRGGCRVVSEHSRIDATVEKRLTTVVAQVLGGERGDDLAEE